MKERPYKSKRALFTHSCIIIIFLFLITLAFTTASYRAWKKAEAEKNYSIERNKAAMLTINNLLYKLTQDLGSNTENKADIEKLLTEETPKIDKFLEYVSETDEGKKEIASCFNNIGKAWYKIDNNAAAENAIIKSIKTLKAVSGKGIDKAVLSELAQTYERLAILMNEDGRAEEAFEYYSNSANVYKELVDNWNDSNAEHNLAETYEKLGDLAYDKDEKLSYNLYLKAMSTHIDAWRETKSKD